MKKGYLSQYFDGVAVKRLSAVEADILRSHQHEFNGVKELKNIFGEPEGRIIYPAKFIYLTDDEEPIAEEGTLTWYDARQKARLERNIRRWEYRMYFPTTHVSQIWSEGDVLIIAKCRGNTLLAIVAEAETTITQQILWLFGFSDLNHPGFSVREELETEQDRIEFASRFILESIGISVQETEESFLDEMLRRFSGKFPSTKIFSEYSRETLPAVTAHDGCDLALMAWLEREEILFKTLEKHLIGEKLSNGFKGDVDGFISFSLSVQNRRKSRAGASLENHIEFLLQEKGIQYTRNCVTENGSKPDFIFPGAKEYRDDSFDVNYLTMLGLKASCKDRWRQILSEADRIPKKHLLTLEAPISRKQTDQMRTMGVQLVLPKKLHQAYLPGQQDWLLTVSDFMQNVLEKQGR